MISGHARECRLVACTPGVGSYISVAGGSLSLVALCAGGAENADGGAGFDRRVRRPFQERVYVDFLAEAAAGAVCLIRSCALTQ
jgi:hypothetical protein